MASCGKRASRSTASAAGAATASRDAPRRLDQVAGDGERRHAPAPISSSSPARIAADAGERAAPQHPLRELDVEPLFEREHQVDARMRGQAGFVEVAVVGQRGHVDRQAAMLAKDRANVSR